MEPTQKEILQEVADEIGGELREYSGRGMYGKSCLGIVCDDPSDCIEEAVVRGIRGACRDSMGKQAIVYWPSIKVEPATVGGKAQGELACIAKTTIRRNGPWSVTRMKGFEVIYE